MSRAQRVFSSQSDPLPGSHIQYSDPLSPFPVYQRHNSSGPSSGAIHQQSGFSHPLQDTSPKQVQFDTSEDIHNDTTYHEPIPEQKHHHRHRIHTPRAISEGYAHGKSVVRGSIHTVEKGASTVGHTLQKVPGIKQSVSFFADYRKFMDRGNVVDLAVAVVVGTAFTAIVTSMVTDVITPIIALASGKNLQENFIILRYNHNATAMALGKPKTRQQAQNAGDITWNWGNFVQTVINFFITSGCVFLIVKVYEVARNKKKEITEKDCPYCFKSIPQKAMRCPNCTTWIDWAECTRVTNLEREAGAIPGSSTQTYPAIFPLMEKEVTQEVKKAVAKSL
ncbi:hypothetical protein BGZ49_006597 [Haplosporangium sp. Z 27]|nr:hypothetical protein BGZ49_006597 [Haplosporangium sp. Z 27]